MPKPFVHLVPRPFPVALDARMAGDQTRFARSGCRPNAILRPVLCKDKRKGVNGSASNGETSVDEDPGTLRYAIFALRDLKACEEIVLGWEWDDGSVVHQLPALIESGTRAGPSKMTCVVAILLFFVSFYHLFHFTTFMFVVKHFLICLICLFFSSAHHIERLRLQMQTIVDSLRSNFVTCACGGAVDDCALRLMEAIADGRFPPPASRRQPNGVPSTPLFNPHIDTNGHLSPSAVTNLSPPNKHPSSLMELKRKRKERAQQAAIDLGPLIGAERGVRTRPVGGAQSGGLHGVELVGGGGRWERNGELEPEEQERYNALTRGRQRQAEMDEDIVPAVHVVEPSPQKSNRKGKARDMPNGILHPSDEALHSSSVSQSPPPAPKSREQRMPPRMRKKWIHERSEQLRSDIKAGRLPSDDSSEQGSPEVAPLQPRKTSVAPNSPVSVIVTTPTVVEPLKERRMNVDFGASFLVSTQVIFTQLVAKTLRKCHHHHYPPYLSGGKCRSLHRDQPLLWLRSLSLRHQLSPRRYLDRLHLRPCLSLRLWRLLVAHRRSLVFSTRSQCRHLRRLCVLVLNLRLQ